MKKIKQMLIDKQFWVFTIITALFFGTLIKLEFATDTYEVFESSGKQMLMHFISTGRFITGFSYAIVKLLKISNTIIYILSFVLAIFSISTSIYKLNKIFNKNEENILISITAILVIINVFSIELFLYIEKGIMCLSVLFCVLAFEQLIKYLDAKDKKALIFTFIYMVLANSAYQGTVAIFVGLSVIYILKYSKNFKEFIINNIITGLCYGIPAAINLIIVKIFANARIVGEHNLNQSLTKIIDGTKNMLKTYEIIPSYVFKFMIILVIGILIYYIIKDKNKKKAISIVSVIYIILGIYVTTVLPQIMQATASIWFVPRSSYAFGAIFAILLVYLLINYKINVKLKKAIVILSVLYLIMQYNGFQIIIRDHYTMNYMDEYFANQIKEKIENYEKETGNIVTKVAFYQKEDIHWSYPNLKAIGDINVRAMAPEWSRIPSLKYYLNREFEETKPDQEVYNRFIKNEKEGYSMDQIYIEKDILNIFIY